jgi:hypothetical protein
MELKKIYKDVSVEEFHVKREGDAFLVTFDFVSAGEAVIARLSGVRATGSLCEILNADRLWVEKTEGTQAEFGCYTLGVSHEYFTEIVFDELLS